MTRTSVFVVEVGYDGPEGYYSTRELADEAAKRVGGDVSECTLDEMPELPGGKYGWFIEFDASGSVLEVRNIPPPMMQRDGDQGCAETERGNIRAWILDATEEGAIRTAREMIARGEFEKYEAPDMTNAKLVAITKEMIYADQMHSLIKTWNPGKDEQCLDDDF